MKTVAEGIVRERRDEAIGESRCASYGSFLPQCLTFASTDRPSPTWHNESVAGPQNHMPLQSVETIELVLDFSIRH